MFSINQKETSFLLFYDKMALSAYKFNGPLNFSDHNAFLQPYINFSDVYQSIVDRKKNYILSLVFCLIFRKVIQPQ